MKYIIVIFGALSLGCTMSSKDRAIDWEELAYENGHNYYEDEYKHKHEHKVEHDFNRLPSATTIAKEKKELDSCSDQTREELDNLDDMILRFDGKVQSPDEYEHSINGLQKFIEDSGLTRYFNAEEMVAANNEAVAKDCGYQDLIPSRCRWKSAVAQGLLTVELRKAINKGRKSNSGIAIRNWWRPACYNSNVGGAKSSDHIQARGFDLDFTTPEERATAQAYLCKIYKEGKPLSLQVGIGCQTLHVGVGSPKRLSRYPRDGSRFWKYGSLNHCSIKRIDLDDCWKQGADGKLYIHVEEGGEGIL